MKEQKNKENQKTKIVIEHKYIGTEKMEDIFREDFIDEIKDYAEIKELNFKILHRLIDKILIFQAEEIDGEKVQKIQIHYKFIGAINTIE